MINRIASKLRSTREDFSRKLNDEWPRSHFWAYRRMVKEQDRRFRGAGPSPASDYHDLDGKLVDRRAIIDELLREGVAVLPYRLFSGQWTADLDRGIRDLKEKYSRGELEAAMLHGGEFGYDKSLVNTGIVRLYHIDRELPAAGDFARHELLQSLGEEYLGKKLSLLTTIAQYNEVSDPPCRGFHIDSWVEQVKAFVYLTDVDENNGPFSYVAKSHLNTNWKLRKMFNGYRSQFDKTRDYGDVTGFADEEVAKTGLEIKRFPAKAGTVILADTRGVHEGASLLEGTRTALVNYYFTA